jgi:hypothetical protein
LWALGEHVLRRELQWFRRPALFSLIVRDSLNPRQLDISKFPKAQLVAFIVTAVEVHMARRAASAARHAPAAAAQPAHRFADPKAGARARTPA